MSQVRTITRFSEGMGLKADKIIPLAIRSQEITGAPKKLPQQTTPRVTAGIDPTAPQHCQQRFCVVHGIQQIPLLGLAQLLTQPQRGGGITDQGLFISDKIFIHHFFYP
jgi:hypothetical protein